MDRVVLPAWNSDLPEGARSESLMRQLDCWVRSEALVELAASWKAEPPRDADGGALYRWYADLSAERWDFRGGQERNLAAIPDLSPSQEQVAMQAATALGLSGSRPPRRKQYDHALVLGGLLRACVTRPRYARELIDSGIDLTDVVALGGFRPLKGDEVTLASTLCVDASNEFEAMVAGLRANLGITVEPNVERSDFVKPANADWAVATFAGFSASVVAAPSRSPAVRRANTADTFAWWVDRHPEVHGSHVLLITSPIYVPYQGAVAIQHLGIPYGISVETVGISQAASDLGPHTQTFSAANYLQEIRSAIGGHLALRELVADAPS